jgi:methyl-accepting chemotaxis protein
MIEIMQAHTDRSVEGMKGTVVKVGGVVHSAEDARTAVDRITSSAVQVEEALRVIDAAMKEQMTASSQIAGRVEQVAQMSEENEAAAGAAAESARLLAGLASSMRDEVAHFKLA